MKVESLFQVKLGVFLGKTPEKSRGSQAKSNNECELCGWKPQN